MKVVATVVFVLLGPPLLAAMAFAGACALFLAGLV